MIPKNFQVSHKPGVYIFKNKNGKVLYVGKAVDLKTRVSQYFNGQDTRPKITNLVSQIYSIETIEVLSEMEALILEANLIKKYLPKYNIKFIDDKDYLYIKITKENFPRVLTARKSDLLNSKIYFGPFPSGNTVRSTLKKLRKIFPWCNGISKNGKACFYAHIGLCSGSCVGKINKHDYGKIINRLIAFLAGNKGQVIKDLETEMNQYAKDQKYEKAQNIKKTIEGINYLTQTNNIQVYLENPNFIEDQNKLTLENLKKDLNLDKIPERIECYDISNISGQFAVGSLVVLNHGDFDKRWYRKFKIKLHPSTGGDVGMIKEVLQRRMKHEEWPKPDLLLIDGGLAQARAIKLKIPVFGLAKRMEWLYQPNGKIIKLSKSSLSLRMLQKIRDEAHKFALSYHRKLREKSLF